MVKVIEKDAPAPQKQRPSKTARTVFVSGIVYQATDEELAQYFAHCGQIEEMKMPRYQDTGRARGYCHITFNRLKAVKLALALDGQDFMGRYLKITKAKGQKSQTQAQKPIPQGCRTVFVGNLPYDCTQDELGSYLAQQCGPVANIRFVFNAVLKHFKGFGYVQFKHEASVSKALKLAGTEWRGRLLRIDAETGQARSGYHNFPIKNTKFGTE